MFFPVITNNLNWEISTKNLVTFKRWDGVKEKNFNIMEVHWKIRFSGGGAWKPSMSRVKCLKTGAWIVCRFKRRPWQKRRGWCFWGGVETPMHTVN